MSQFENYGLMAADDVDETAQNGRYTVQKSAESNIPRDVISKLAVRNDDVVLDVGCGMGLTLLPVSELAVQVYGCDHPQVVSRLESKVHSENITLLPGGFLETRFDTTFDKVLIYSVIPSLPDKETVYAFVEKGLSLLKPSGRMLLGDLANTSKKARFLNSNRGQEFQRNWEELRRQSDHDDSLTSYPVAQTVSMDDGFVLDLLKHIREKGYDAYVMPQPSNLPFGNTREDILVFAPEAENA